LRFFKGKDNLGSKSSYFDWWEGLNWKM